MNNTLEFIEFCNSEQNKLDLSYQQLADNDIPGIVDFLSQNPNIQRLNIRHNNLSEQGAEILANNSTLTSLDISENPIGNQGAMLLWKINTTLEILLMSKCHISDEGFIGFSNNKNLKNLLVHINHIGLKGAEEIAASTTLKFVDLRFNHVGDGGAKFFAANHSIEVLELALNNLSELGALTIAALNTYLDTLDVGIYPTQITGQNVSFYFSYSIEHEIIDQVCKEKQYKSGDYYLHNKIQQNEISKCLIETDPLKRENIKRSAGFCGEGPALLKLCLFKVKQIQDKDPIILNNIIPDELIKKINMKKI